MGGRSCSLRAPGERPVALLAAERCHELARRVIVRVEATRPGVGGRRPEHRTREPTGPDAVVLVYRSERPDREPSFVLDGDSSTRGMDHSGNAVPAFCPESGEFDGTELGDHCRRRRPTLQSEHQPRVVDTEHACHRVQQRQWRRRRVVTPTVGTLPGRSGSESGGNDPERSLEGAVQPAAAAKLATAPARRARRRTLPGESDR